MTINYFKLFHLAEQFTLDEKQLTQTYRQLAAQFHPDKTASASSFEQKQSVMMTSIVNQAYQVLQNPIDRAAYLLQLQNIDADAPEHTSFAPEFLMQQMQWREELMDAKMEKDESKLQQLQAEIIREQAQLHEALKQAFEKQDYEYAANLVRQGRFLNKMQREIDVAM